MTATAQTGRKSAPRVPKQKRLTRAQRTAVLKALADPKRFELLERIARSNCPLGCGDALKSLAIAPATLSHHVKELENAGLIEVRREGKFAFLSTRTEVLTDLIAVLGQFVPRGCDQLEGASNRN